MHQAEHKKMEISALWFMPLGPPALAIPVYTNPEAVKLARARGRRSWKLGSGDGTGGDDIPKPPTITPTDTVEIKFKRGSRKRRQKLARDEADGAAQPLKARSSTSDAPKKWEEMSIPEKAMELYVGEKGALFWLNKFAYASIFIVIGGWILFRFVGPAFNLYQLDTPPLAPSSLFKGS